MLVALARRPLLSGFLLLASICIALAWLFSGQDAGTKPSGRVGGDRGLGLLGRQLGDAETDHRNGVVVAEREAKANQHLVKGV